MTTVKEIAKKSGYSPATVSRLLNNDPTLSITANTKNKILKLANQLGYWETHQNKKLKPTIALLYRINHQEQLQDQYFISLKEKIVTIAAKQGLPMKVFENINELIDQADQFQGFLGVGSDELSYKSLEKLHQRLPNGVFIDTNPASNLFDSVKPNLILTVKNAIDLLLKQGYQKIGFIGANGPSFNGIYEKDIRTIVFEEYAAMRKIEIRPMYVSGTFSVDNGYKLGKQVAKQPLPEAFVIASDTLSVGVLQAFNEEKINIPSDVAIISINNSNVAKYVSPPITTYSINQEEMIRRAIDLVTNLIMQPNRPREELFVNTKLVVRKSFIPKI